MENNTVYIHYGHAKFDLNLWTPVRNDDKCYILNKPIGGLWASRVDSEFGWKEWCRSEYFRKCEESNSFKFKLKENSNVHTITSVNDARKLPLLDKVLSYDWDPLIDYEKCLLNGIDAIEVIYDFSRRDSYDMMLGFWWDCDSIVVLNPDIILPL